MYKDMDPEILREYIRNIQNRYAELELNAEQAVKMLELEDDKTITSFDAERRIESFSFWEQQDYELDEARRFLTEHQLGLYANRQCSAAEAHEVRLKEEDEKQAKELVVSEEYTIWLREQFLPGMLKELIHVPIVFSMEREKVAYLRAEYQRYLAVSRHNALVRHYRQYKTLAPNRLRIALLREERLAILPSYGTFIDGADDAVKSAGSFLADKYRGFAERGAEFFRKKSAESNSQYAEIRMRHIGERERSGWRVTIMPKTSLTEAQHGLMAMMLVSDKFTLK